MVRPALPAFLLLLAACTRPSPDYVGANEQSAICQQYLACAAGADPAVFTTLVPVYGPDGSCWSDATLAASCTLACARGVTDLDCAPQTPQPSLDMTVATTDFGWPAPPDLSRASPRDLSQPPPPDLSPPPPRDLASPPPVDLSMPSDMSCLPAFYECNGDPGCCAQCCGGGCASIGWCALY
jgi:hypothetical protein